MDRLSADNDHRDDTRMMPVTPVDSAQGLLFSDDLPELSEDLGYRGPTACTAAGITYRQLDYWARTGLVEPSIRGAHGSGSQAPSSAPCWKRVSVWAFSVGVIDTSPPPEGSVS